MGYYKTVDRCTICGEKYPLIVKYKGKTLCKWHYEEEKTKDDSRFIKDRFKETQDLLGRF